MLMSRAAEETMVSRLKAQTGPPSSPSSSRTSGFQTVHERPMVRLTQDTDDSESSERMASQRHAEDDPTEDGELTYPDLDFEEDSE